MCVIYMYMVTFSDQKYWLIKKLNNVYENCVKIISKNSLILKCIFIFLIFILAENKTIVLVQHLLIIDIIFYIVIDVINTYWCLYMYVFVYDVLCVRSQSALRCWTISRPYEAVFCNHASWWKTADVCWRTVSHIYMIGCPSIAEGFLVSKT